MRREIDVVFINEKEKKSSTAKTGQRKISVVSLVVIHCHLLHHSLSLVTTQCTTSVFL